MQKAYAAIVGVGRTKFGEHYEVEPERLIDAAGLAALNSAKIERRDLQGIYFANYFLQITNKIGLEEGFMSELLELHVPMETVRCFSSALHNAINALNAGHCDVALVGGVEKMTDRSDKIRDDLMLLDCQWSYFAGGTPEANHELMLREYVKKHRLSQTDQDRLMTALAQISVKNHYYGSMNEYAQFYGRKITIDDVFKERKASGKSLGLYDFAPISDGATALILVRPELAHSYSDKPTYVTGYSSATDFISYPMREDRSAFLSTRLASGRALRMAGTDIRSIGLAEVCDPSTVSELNALEDLGFLKRGEAWRSVYKSYQDGTWFYETDSGPLFINTNGGCKADGIPLGAKGGAHIIEIVTQMRKEAGPRQIKGDRELTQGIALEHEGFGTKSYVHVLTRE